jgi:hypothetical protein
MTICTHPPVLGKLPAHLDPFGLIGGRQAYPLRLRFGDEGGDGTGAGDGDSDDSDNDKDDKLGDAGQRALDRAKQRDKESRAALKEYADLGLTAAEIKAIVDEKNKGNAPDAEAIAKQAQRDADKVANDRLHGRLRSSSVREQAASLEFIDPSEALALIDRKALDAIDVDDDDEVDAPAIKKLLEELATKKPHLLKPKDSVVDSRIAGIGARGSGAKPESKPGRDRLRSAYESSGK